MSTEPERVFVLAWNWRPIDVGRERADGAFVRFIADVDDVAEPVLRAHIPLDVRREGWYSCDVGVDLALYPVPLGFESVAPRLASAIRGKAAERSEVVRVREDRLRALRELIHADSSCPTPQACVRACSLLPCGCVPRRYKCHVNEAYDMDELFLEARFHAGAVVQPILNGRSPFG